MTSRSWTARLDAGRLARDPDGSRFRGALGATLAAGLASGLAFAFGDRIGLPASAPPMTGVLAMIASVTVAETNDERATFGLLFVPVTTGLALGIGLAPHPVLSLVVFVLGAFAAVMLQRLGPRGTAAGTIGFHAYFFALFFGVPIEETGSVIAAGWLAIGVAALVRLALSRHRTSRAVRGSLRALPILAARVLRSLAAVLRGGDAGVRGRERRLAFQRLNEAALVLEDHLELASDAALGLSTDAVKKRGFELELAAERVGAGVLSLVRNGEMSAASRDAAARALDATVHVLEGGAQTDEAGRALGDARREAAGQPHVGLAIDRLEDALGALRSACHPTYDPGTSGSISRAPAAPKKATPPPEGLHATTRLAIQAALATAVAVLVGRWISPERWFWAAIAAYLVIAPATTRGEILVRAGRRTFGTILGVMLGVLVATLASGHARLELVLLFVCIFLAMESRKASHTVMVIWLTAAFALLYELTGRYSVGLLALRLEETAAGAAIGALSAALVLPSRTGTRLRTALARFTALLAEDLEDLTLALTQHERASRARVRALDRALLDVRASAEPLTRAGYRLSPATSDLVRACSTLAFYARQLALPGLLAGTDAAAPELERVLAALARDARAIAATLEDEEAAAPAEVPLAPLRAAIDRARADDAPHALDFALLCTERMNVTLGEVRAVLPKR